MKEIIPAVRNAIIFSSITDAEMDSMLNCLGARVDSYEKEIFILRPGATASEMGLLISGSLLIVQEDYWGNRNILSRISPGQLFAESFACSPGAVLNVGVVTDSDCRVMWLDVGHLMHTCPSACGHHSRIIKNLLSDIAGKNLRLNEKLTHMGQRTTREKLLSYLSAESQRQGTAQFYIPFSRQQLADYLSVERSAMSAELGKLRDEGILRFDKNHFVLLS